MDTVANGDGLVIRGNLREAYPDVLTAEAIDALEKNGYELTG